MPRRKVVRFADGTEFYTIHPIDGVTIPGRKAVEQVVTEAEWLVINEFQPPAFVCDPLPPEEDKIMKEGE